MSKDALETENRAERAQRLGREIVEECRVQLMMKFRFLDLALWKMDLRPTAAQGRYTLSTDGTHVYFEPYTVMGRFDAAFEEMVRDYLHMVMHCLFRHPFDNDHSNVEAWWLVCDVLAENAAMELCGTRFASPLDEERCAALEDLTELCHGRLTPGNLYGLFVRSLRARGDAAGAQVSGGRMNELQALFERDLHRPWPAYRTTLGASGHKELEIPQEGGEQRESDSRDMVADATVSEDERREQDVWDTSGQSDLHDTQEESEDALSALDESAQTVSDAIREDSASSEQGQGSGEQELHEEPSAQDVPLGAERSEDEQTWEELARQVEVDLETFSADWGVDAGGFVKTLSVANRKKQDYSVFLRRFAALSEEMKVNDDEFDYVFYTYGLKLYGNLPLIEPLEYKETHRIRDFVICIDTSESCEGERVRAFVEHTFSMLKGQEDFAHSVNIHVIQADSRVQSDTVLRDLRDVDAFMDSFTVRGFGGTDFRPAFSYVNELVAQGELPDMKGVIYFTDGIGRFPDVAPAYDVAFVFLDEGCDVLPKVPPWAMRILIDEAGMDRMRGAHEDRMRTYEGAAG